MGMKRRLLYLFLFLLLAGAAVPKDRKGITGIKGTRSIDETEAGVSWAKHVLQGFNMRIWLTNQIAFGLEAWDPGVSNASQVPPGDCGDVGIGLEYPVGGCVEHMFGGGPWIGGLVDGVRRVDESYNGDDARHEFMPERTDTARDRIWYTHAGSEDFYFKNRDVNGYNGYYYNHAIQVNRRGCDDDGDGKVDEDELDGQDNDGDWNPLTDDLGSDGLPDSLEAGCDQKVYDSVTNPDPAYDNYDPFSVDKCHTDANGNYVRKNSKASYTQNNGIPDHGEPHVDEDYAGISESDYYAGATDTFKTATQPGQIPMGIQWFMKSYAWAEEFADGVLPFDYLFVNIGQKTIKQVYVAFFCDMDVGPTNVSGYFSHDYACYIPDLRTAYIHNAVDRGSTPMGLTVLHTPRPLDSLQYIFQWHGFSEPGTLDSTIYCWMSAQCFTDKIKPCQSPSSPTDTPFFFSFGPFDEMKPGDTLKISVALVGGYGVEGGPHNLRENAENALKLYKRGYLPPLTLPQPPLKVTEGFKKVRVEWGRHIDPTLDNPLDLWDDSSKIAQSYPDTSFRRRDPPCQTVVGTCSNGHRCIDGYLTGGRIFEGYRLYRSEAPSNTPGDQSWTLLKQYDIADDNFEYNVGIDSVFIDSNLTRGKRYWYSVTSFGIPDLTIIETVDSSGNVRFDSLYAQNTESAKIRKARVDLSFSVADTLGKVLVVPNPYRVDQDYTYENGGWEGRSSNWTENNRLVKFIHLPTKCTIRIFTLTGDQVATLDHNDEVHGELEWNLLSQSGRALASGVYIFSVESTLGQQIGKFVLIR